MKHHVFISHSSNDKEIAKAICHYLEEDGIPCWIAPRDIDQPDWAAAIMGGIRRSNVFVVILSHNSIPSNEVMKEVAEATRVSEYILPFKIDEELLSDGMQYHLGPIHWMDAVTPPMEQRILELRERIQHLTADDKAFKNHARLEVLGKTVMPRPFFVGRETEIDEIHRRLQQEHVLFLQGMGGIGKSEIAKGYAEKYKEDYNKILFATYRGRLLDMVIGDEIRIKGITRSTAYGEDAESSEAYFARKLQTLKDLSSEKALLIVDSMVILLCFSVYGTETGILSLFAIAIRALVVDGAIDSFNSSKFLLIITDKEEAILQYIMHDLERGASVVNHCVGAYTNQEKKMIVSVMDKRESAKLKKKIKEIDPMAFVIVGTTNDIQGDGFKPIS